MSKKFPSKGAATEKRRREETGPATETDNPNADICRILLELADYEQNSKGSQWGRTAYRKAAQVLADQKNRVTSGKDAEELPGIGKGISAVIDEYLTTGGVKKVKKARTDESAQLVEELARVPGIGFVNAKRLIEEGVTSIEDLRNHEHILNHAQKIGLKYLEEIEKPIARKTVENVGQFIETEFKKLHEHLELTLCGAYRRGDATITEIIGVVTHRSRTADNQLMDEIVEALQKSGLLTEIISHGDHGLKAVINWPVRASHGEASGSHYKDVPNPSSPSKNTTKEKEKSHSPKKSSPSKQEKRNSADEEAPHGHHHLLELHLYSDRQYYTAILKWTGNDLFVQEMNSKAKSEGFLLNTYGVYRHRPEEGEQAKESDAVELKSEKDIFRALDMDYVKPEDRNVA